MTITVRYSSIDGVRMTRNFKTLAGARKFATEYVGPHPEIGSSYAVAGDGVGKVTVSGATLAELFGADKPAASRYAIAFDDVSEVWVVTYAGRTLGIYETNNEAREHVSSALAYDAY